VAHSHTWGVLIGVGLCCRRDVRIGGEATGMFGDLALRFAQRVVENIRQELNGVVVCALNC
jgi:hypothetical protein